ncbi:MAG: hypothetical protein C0506_04605 [Anaerolinea sp.]|nr:hypothetical protein [Anaerolinea sp.]
MTTREALHALIDELPEEELPLAEARLRGLDTHDAAGIPYDDEPYTEDDAKVSDERWAGYRRGEFVSMAEARKQLDAS